MRACARPALFWSSRFKSFDTYVTPAPPMTTDKERPAIESPLFPFQIRLPLPFNIERQRTGASFTGRAKAAPDFSFLEKPVVPGARSGPLL